MKLSNLLLVAFAASLLSACVRGESVRDLRLSRGGSPRDAHALQIADRVSTDAVQAWEQAGARALRSGLSIAPSFRERIRFPAHSAQAVAYRFTLASGQALRVRVSALDGQTVFTEVFQAIGTGMFRHVLAARSREFDYTAPVDGEYVLRLQPPLGGGGLFDVTVTPESGLLSGASLLFPVADAGVSAIGSPFGESRDGGARSHEGVDIFAPRGTPVLAVTSGRVSGVRHTPVGGKVVWLDDAARPLSYYYAHLDRQLVRDGQWVDAGDTLGTVGTTGNAAGTPPHLHFGVYRPGTLAVNPKPFLIGTPVQTTVLLAGDSDTSALGHRLQIAGERVRLRSSPSLSAAVVAELSGATALLVLGAVGDWHRVVLDDGTSGFVSARFGDVTQGSMR